MKTKPKPRSKAVIRDEPDELEQHWQQLERREPAFAVMTTAYEKHRQLVRQLREARERAGLTQQEVADRTGTTQAVIARFEKFGRDPRLSTIARYAAVVGLRLELTPSSSQ